MEKITIKLRKFFGSESVGITARVYHGGDTAHISLAQYNRAHKKLCAAVGEKLTFSRRDLAISDVFVWDSRDKSGNPCMSL